MRARRFDVVLMDVQMPEMNGFEATQPIRAASATARRTADHRAHRARDARRRERCLDAGMDGYVSKPVRAAGALRRIERATARHRGVARRGLRQPRG